jgi:hypothetical protein
MKALQTATCRLLCVCHTVLTRLSHGGWGDTPRHYARDGHLSSEGGSVRRKVTSSIPYARRNGRAFASLTARGGGLPVGVRSGTYSPDPNMVCSPEKNG